MQQSARIFFIDYTVTFKNLFNTRLLTKDKNKKRPKKLNVQFGCLSSIKTCLEWFDKYFHKKNSFSNVGMHGCQK